MPFGFGGGSSSALSLSGGGFILKLSNAQLFGIVVATILLLLFIFGKKSDEGSQQTGTSTAATQRSNAFSRIPDQYETLEQVQAALRKAGLESSQLVVGIDATRSNTWTGAKTFGGRCLHEIRPGELNPYEEAISIIGRTLAAFDDDGMIPAFYFGDAATTDRRAEQLGAGACNGFDEVLQRYRATIPRLTLSGPTSFAPIIDKAIELVKRTREYTILLIIADGQVDGRCKDETEAAIVRASAHPLSILIVGVGDGPFDLMETWDDELPARRFDNVQFVNAGRITGVNVRNRDAAFAIAALQEIPDQYAAVRRLRLL